MKAFMYTRFSTRYLFLSAETFLKLLCVKLFLKFYNIKILCKRVFQNDLVTGLTPCTSLSVKSRKFKFLLIVSTRFMQEVNR